jgi:hypothetical protein
VDVPKTVLVLACLLVAGCSGGVATVAAPAGTTSAGTLTAGLAGRHAAELDVVSGASSVRVRSADLGGDLYRTWAPAQVQVRGDVVQVSVTGGGAADVLVEVNSVVLWRIALDGGASEEDVDMAGGRLAELDFDAGASRITAELPRPQGTVPVRMTGGSSSFDVRLPPQTDAQVVLAGGAGQASIDGDLHTGVAGGTVLATPGWDTAVNRYAVDNAAGVSSFALDRSS